MPAAALTAPLDRAACPVPLPRPGDPLRVAFVGRATLHAAGALHTAGPLDPAFLDARAGDPPAALRARLDAVAPHVIVAFDPPSLPAGALDGVPAATLGVVTATLPRGRADARPDLGAALAAAAAFDPAPYDRLVAHDPLAREALDLWRVVPPAVDDGLFAPVAPSRRPPRALFLGASTEHRERWLIDAKHAYDLLHLAGGLAGPALAEALGRADVGIALHRGNFASVSRATVLHLAAGHLLIAQTLAATHGLEPGTDFLEVARADELMALLDQLARRPDAYERVRLRGRAKAEAHRASRVWPRLLGDLLADLCAFGTARR